MVRSNYFDRVPNQVREPQEDKNLREFFGILKRRWVWLLLFTAVAVGTAWLYLQYQTPEYLARGTMFVRNERNQVNIEQQLTTNPVAVKKDYFNLETEIQVLKSWQLMRQVVDSLNIHIKYFVEGKFIDQEYFDELPVRLSQIIPEKDANGVTFRLRVRDKERFILYHGETDTLLGRFNVPFTVDKVTYVLEPGDFLPKGIVRIEVKDRDKAARKFAATLQVNSTATAARPSDVIVLALEDPVPSKAEAIINSVVIKYNQEQLDKKRQSERKALDFIDERLEYITAELYAVEQQVEGFKRDRQLPSEINYSANQVLAQLEKRDEEMATVELQNQLLAGIESAFRSSTGQYQLLPIVSGTFQGALAQLVTDYNALVLQRERMLSSATPDNPAVQTIGSQLEQMKSTIRLNIETTRKELRDRKSQMEQRIEPIQARIDALPTYERQLLQIMRQQQIKEQLFLFLLQRREETAIALSAQVADSEMLDQAVTVAQVYPKNSFVYTVSFLFGFFLPLGLMFTFYYLDNNIYTEKDIKTRTLAPFLGAVNQSMRRDKVVVRPDSRSSTAEMFRMLRTNLQFMTSTKEKAVFLITSSLSGEGKTFTSINTAMSMAISGKKTIVLGFDLRKPKLAGYIVDNPPEKGLSNFLVNQATLDEVIQPTPLHKNLDFIGSGTLPPNPAELIMSDATRELFAQLQERYDCIIVDAPPVGLVTDAFLLKEYVNATLFVVRYGSTKKDDLDIIDEIYRNKILPSPGIILNGVKATGRYGNYRYGKKYGYYVEPQRVNFLRRLSRKIGLVKRAGTF